MEKDNSTKEEVLAKDDKPSEEIENGPKDREEELLKRGFEVICLVANIIN